MSNRLVSQKTTIASRKAQEEKEALIQEILEKVDHGRTTAMFLAFGATLKEKLGLSEESLFEIFESVDQLMGTYNTMSSIKEFRKYVSDTYQFDLEYDANDVLKPEWK